MKKIFFYLSLVLLFITLSCSNDDNAILDPVIEPIPQAEVTSYSKDYGYSGEKITLLGRNFGSTIDDIKLTFDNTQTEIVSVKPDAIEIILPESTNTLPDLELTIKNQTVSFNVINSYDGKIGILPKPGTWSKIEIFAYNDVVWKVQAVDKESFYLSINDNGGGGHVYRTLDGGISWKRWAPVGFNGSFLATETDAGWTEFGGNLNNVPSGGDGSRLDFIFTLPDTNNSGIVGMYVDNSIQKGVLVTVDRVSYVTDNAKDFSEEYNNTKNQIELRVFDALNENNIWAGGQSRADRKPILLYKNENTLNTWKEKLFNDSDLLGFRVNQIEFVSPQIGYLLIKKFDAGTVVSRFFKTINGGDDWSEIPSSLMINSITFQTDSIGWAVSANKIYKTTDGGVTWEEVYANDDNIGKITYEDNTIWALSTNSIIKKVLE